MSNSANNSPTISPAPTQLGDVTSYPWVGWFQTVIAALNRFINAITIGSGNKVGIGTAPRQQFSVGPYFDMVTGSSNPSTVQSIRLDSFGNTVINGSGTGAVYFGYDNGTGGVNFCNGAGAVVAYLNSAGAFNLPSAQFTAPQNIAFGSNWIGYTPAVRGGGSMTVASLSVIDAQYLRIGPKVEFKVYFTCTLGGTAANLLTVAIPVAAVGANSLIASAVNTSTTAWTAAFGPVIPGSTVVNLQLNGAANFPLGALSVLLAGSYRCT